MSLAGRQVGGYVKDAYSFEPIPSVAVRISFGTIIYLPVYTNSAGYWQTPIPSGRSYDLKMSKTGYDDATGTTGTIPGGTTLYLVETVHMYKTTGPIELPKAEFKFESVEFPSAFNGPGTNVLIKFRVVNAGTGAGTPTVWATYIMRGAEVIAPKKQATVPLAANGTWSGDYVFMVDPMYPSLDLNPTFYVGFDENNIHDRRESSFLYAGKYLKIDRIDVPTEAVDAGAEFSVVVYVTNIVSTSGSVSGDVLIISGGATIATAKVEVSGGQTKSVAFKFVTSKSIQPLAVVMRNGARESEMFFIVSVKSAPTEIKVTVSGAVGSPAGAIIDANIKVNGVQAKYTYSNNYLADVPKAAKYVVTATKVGYKNYSATITDDGRNAYTHDIDMWPEAVTYECPTGYHWDEASQSCVSDTGEDGGKPLVGKGSIQGIAVNSADNTAIPDALVRLNTGQAAYTSETGNFSFANLDPGDYTVYGSAAMGRISLDSTRIVNPLQSLSVQPVQVKVEADRVSKVTLIYSPTEINPVWVATGIVTTASVIAAVIATRKPKRAPPRKRRAPRKPVVHMNRGRAK